ncbi:hypothetical protein LZ31DRAFT_393770 [Colletotrichum somersetense]|nr:hypothetical protein LZ31DRAFT_393770 [Colletotrichum somersetense]
MGEKQRNKKADRCRTPVRLSRCSTPCRAEAEDPDARVSISWPWGPVSATEPRHSLGTSNLPTVSADSKAIASLAELSVPWHHQTDTLSQSQECSRKAIVTDTAGSTGGNIGALVLFPPSKKLACMPMRRGGTQRDEGCTRLGEAAKTVCWLAGRPTSAEVRGKFSRPPQHWVPGWKGFTCPRA